MKFITIHLHPKPITSSQISEMNSDSEPQGQMSESDDSIPESPSPRLDLMDVLSGNTVPVDVHTFIDKMRTHAERIVSIIDAVRRERDGGAVRATPRDACELMRTEAVLYHILARVELFVENTRREDYIQGDGSADVDVDELLQAIVGGGSGERDP